MCKCDKTDAPCHCDGTEKYIQIVENGPYLVFGEDEVVQEIIIPDSEGASWQYEKTKMFKNPDSSEEHMALCRCGESRHKPFCDGTHEKINWDGEETAGFEPILEGAEEIRGPNLTLTDNEKYCAYARFCDAKGRVWNLVMEGTPETDELAVREACNCPAGRLMMKKNKDGAFIEPELKPEVSILEDPGIECSGPIWVKGGIEVKSAKGKSYEVRNRQTLCRYGKSSNKPFCDGSHASVQFQDDL